MTISDLKFISGSGRSKYRMNETRARLEEVARENGLTLELTQEGETLKGKLGDHRFEITAKLDPVVTESRASLDLSWASEFFAPLAAMQEQCYAEAASKGWHPGDAEPGTEAEINEMACRLMCSHEEISELWSAVRGATFRDRCDKADKMEAIGLPALTCGEEEFADRFIRLLDEAQTHGIDMRKAVAVKMLYNRSRPHRHGGKKR